MVGSLGCLDSAMRLDSGGWLVAHGSSGMDSGLRGKEALDSAFRVGWIPAADSLLSGAWNDSKRGKNVVKS